MIAFVRSILDVVAKAMVLAASGHDINLQTIERTLKARWSDDDLRARDMQKKAQHMRTLAQCISVLDDLLTWDWDGDAEQQEEEVESLHCTITTGIGGCTSHPEHASGGQEEASSNAKQ